MKRYGLLLVFAVLLFSSCSTSKKTAFLDNYTFLLTEISTDETYGYTEGNPIKVGGARQSEGPPNERRFLNALLGPNGEAVKYNRQGSCCHFSTPNGILGGGLLDRYEVTYEGLEKPIILFINMYDKDGLKAPKGFTFKKAGNSVMSRPPGVPSQHANSK